MTYLLAMDQGTSSTRAMVYTTLGELVCAHQEPLTTHYPKLGWVEQDPELIWSSTHKAIQAVLTQIPAHKIAACGISNQRETTVVWDKSTGACLGPAIVWQDRRTESNCQRLASHASLIEAKTGLRLDPYFSATKLAWLINHYPEAKRLASIGQLAFGTIDSFLLWRLTGGRVHATDVTNASRTLLFNIHQLCWDDALLSIFGIERCLLPEVLPCDAHFGDMDLSLFGHAIPITGMMGDQQAALIGQACTEPGMIKATYGTGGFLLQNTGASVATSRHKLLSTVAYQIQGQTAYGLEGSIYQAGSIIKWLRDSLGLIERAKDSEALARSIQSNEGVYLIPSFTGLGAPYWSNQSGAALLGLTQSSGRAHIVRAALECVAYQTRDVLQCMADDSGLACKMLRVDGGMVANDWLLEYLASLCHLNIQRPRDIELTAKGVAFVAGIGIRLIPNLQMLEPLWQQQAYFKPQANLTTVEADYQGWLAALKRFL